MSMGKRIRELREGLCLNQKQMAEFLRIGQGSLSKIENGQLDLNYRSLVELRKQFGFNLNQFIDQEIKESQAGK